MTRPILIGPFAVRPLSWESIRETGRALVRAKHELATFTIHGKPFRMNPVSFRYHHREYFLLGKHDFTTDVESPVVVDLGANTGLAVLDTKLKHPKARVYAWEPDPYLANIMRENLEAHEVHDVEIVEAAAWTSDGEATFASDGRATGSVQGAGELGGTIVQTRDIAAWLEDLPHERIQLLKIDIEGAELELLPHIRHHLHRCDNLIVEIHLGDEDEGTLVSSIFELVEGSGLKLQHLDTHTSPAVPLDGAKNGMHMRLAFDAYFTRA